MSTYDADPGTRRADDPLPTGFLAQLLLPFRKLPAGAAGEKP